MCRSVRALVHTLSLSHRDAYSVQAEVIAGGATTVVDAWRVVRVGQRRPNACRGGFKNVEAPSTLTA